LSSENPYYAEEQKMTANINTETGIRYGVISANNARWLANDIYDYGENLTRLGLNEQFGDNECEYGYVDSDGNQFLLGYLGGSPLIWCIKTNTIVYVKSLCSPCVPNAGDLDSGLTDEHNGYACYGVPTHYLENEE